MRVKKIYLNAIKSSLINFGINSKKINESVMDRENNRDPDGAGGKKNWGKHNPYANFDWVMK